MRKVQKKQLILPRTKSSRKNLILLFLEAMQKQKSCSSFALIALSLNILLVEIMKGFSHKLLGNFFATSGISNTFCSIRATFCNINSFKFSINSEKSEKLLVHKWALLPQCFSGQSLNFLWKKRQIPPPPSGADCGCKMHAAAKSAYKDSHATDSSVLGEEFFQD